MDRAWTTHGTGQIAGPKILTCRLLPLRRPHDGKWTVIGGDGEVQKYPILGEINAARAVVAAEGDPFLWPPVVRRLLVAAINERANGA
jgi:hypothetical protein